MTPDQKRAALGVGTGLLQHLIPQGDPDQTTEDEPENEQPENKSEEKSDSGMVELELSMTKKLDQIAQDLKNSQKLELEAIKNDIKNALAKSS